MQFLLPFFLLIPPLLIMSSPSCTCISGDQHTIDLLMQWIIYTKDTVEGLYGDGLAPVGKSGILMPRSGSARAFRY
jgi:hypothetical protein